MGVTPQTARQIASAVHGGALTASQLAASALERADASQPYLNAFTSIDHSGAAAAARVVDESLRGAPLAGVPVAVKDLIDHEGRPNTRGTSATVVPDTTAPVISRLEDAGAVVIGRTGLHEFAFGFSSENHWHGPVHNPWDTSLSPGGSSGGSAAAVAAGVVPVALGTDTGGSVRVPAALCGIVGLKVTHGRVPLTGVFPLGPMLDTVGPIGRTVADCAAVYEVIAGDDPSDPWSVPRRVEPAGRPVDLAEVRIGVPHPWVDRPVDSEQRAAFEELLDGLAGAGAAVTHLTAEGLVSSPLATTGVFYEVARVHRDRFEEDPERFGPEVRRRVASALEITGDEFVVALEWRSATRSAALRALDGVDALVTPTVAARRKTIGVDAIRIGSDDVHYVSALSAFTVPVNHIGFPALAVPLPGDGVPPPSAQLIGPPWGEANLLAIGLAMEAKGLVETRTPPGWPRPPVDPNGGRAA